MSIPTTQAVLDSGLYEAMKALSMPHARRQAAELLETARVQRWGPHETLAAVLDIEVAGRQAVSLQRRLRALGVPESKTLATFNAELSTVPDQTLQYLTELDWVNRQENLVIAGPAGTGKTHLCQALAHKVVTTGGKAQWLTLAQLEELVAAYRVDNRVDKKIHTLTNCDLVVIDDIGLLPVSDQAAEALYRVVEACYERTSIALSSNLHPASFDTLMPKTLATATVDRLLHHAHLVQTSGDSVRMTQALSTSIIPT
ncbi:MAG: IS21-like element helper ATPase IstB [Yaniella sp.]|uniref:IS21-like element helper ATPase IstB n=1 Tax=Yaniella sp. TaxID=2773929 RepID=UPI00264993E3|nr:IS21-like element helper ATPase IstB [Yaniella sp.]MDN5703795.1 IS21-like element helper ATPase IstB [Yaniella sp.]MDN5816386.1 IS21-like element helper ATPase IstB [Yaniella sp.]MDN5818298.1 IS21-like element helper ATPase IstB [Yaniella sp.]MDN5889845.1 IS21-like element helper ATPase IstB [Yaniella sp.]MDN6149294.1 IS21-like element helper ATPase IstB [Yaniella sp.]